MSDIEYYDANLRPIYCSEDSRIMWNSVSRSICYGTYMSELEYCK